MRNILISLILVLMLASFSNAVEYLGARSLGMGGVMASLGSDASCLFANPAGISGLKNWAATTTSAGLSDQSKYSTFAFILPTDQGNIGVGYSNVITPSGLNPTTKIGVADQNPITTNSKSVVLSYGCNLNRHMPSQSNLGTMAFGANLGVKSEDLIVSNGTAGSQKSATYADLGLIMYPNSFLSVGGVLKDLGTQAGRFICGGSLTFFDQALLVSQDTESAGVEIKFIPELALRAGQGSGKSTYGVGVKLSSVSVDLAMRQGPSDIVRYVTFSFAPES